MQTMIVVIATALVSIFVAFILWEYLVKRGGGVVVLDANSSLMRKWSALNPGKDPRNICEMTQVIWGHRRVGHQLLLVVDALEASRLKHRVITPMVLLPTILVLFLGFVFSIAFGRNSSTGAAMMDILYLFILIGMGALAMGILAAFLWIMTRPIVIGMIRATWLGLCPPVQVRRATQESPSPAKSGG